MREWIAEGRLRSGLACCLHILLYLGMSAIPASPPDPSSPEKVSICQLAADPARFNHKLIEVTGLMKDGFEDFSLFDPECAHGSVWLDYGGEAASGTVYCWPGCPDRTREKPLVIENIEIPLVDDEQFRSFDRLIHARPDTVVHATIVGRFFSGRSRKMPSARVLSVDEESITGMTEASTRPGRVVYEWRPHSEEAGYMVVVSRPYWLSFYAADPDKVAWVVIGAYESSCPK